MLHYYYKHKVITSYYYLLATHSTAQPTRVSAACDPQACRLQARGRMLAFPCAWQGPLPARRLPPRALKTALRGGKTGAAFLSTLHVAGAAASARRVRTGCAESRP